MGVRDISGAGATDAQVLETVQSDGTFEFQQATTISTTTGDITLNASSNAVAVRSGSSSTASKISMGTDVNKSTIGCSGGTDTFFTGTVAGDLVVRADDNNNKVHIGAGTSGIAGMVVTEVANVGKVGVGTAAPGAQLDVRDTTTSSANTGGHIRLSADDGAAMGDSHRLGVIDFTGAEDAGGSQTVGARIEVMTDAAWSASENGAAFYFYTTDGDASQSSVLKLDSNKKATFSGVVDVAGTAPDVTLRNSTSENTAGGCESKIIFEDHGDNALGQIEVSHVGTSDDEKGQLILSTNNDSGLQAALTISEAQAATFAGNVDITGGLSFDAGTAVTSIDTDISSVSGSDDTLASAKAIKTYVDAAAGGGDITGVTAGVGLSGGGSSGGVTLTLDLSELSTVTPADGDFFATLDSDGANEQKTTTTALATLLAGTGLTASSSVIGVDASQTQITSVGTIGTGTWQGTAVASAYLDADTAHLSGTQTFSGAKSFSDVVDITDATDASDATGDTGALRCEGGASIAKKLYVGTDLDVTGTLKAAGVSISNNDSGANNTVLGLLAGEDLAAGGNQNVLVGENAGKQVTTGDDNVIIGYNAGVATLLTGQNVIIGSGAAAAVMTADADGSVVIGYGAGAAITSGAENTVVGLEALKSEDAGEGCTAIGYKALTLQNVDSAKNTAVGNGAGQLMTGSVQSTYIGFEAGKGAGGDKPTGENNTFVGYQAGVAHANNANNNTMVGHQAGDGLAVADQNTGVGSGVVFATGADNQMALGYGADTSGGGANSIKIGNASVTRANIQVDWTIDSDERVKQDIEDNALGLAFINDLTPRKYRKLHPADWAEEIREKRYENDERDEFDDVKVWDGLIAQEVKEAVDKSSTTFSGWSVDTNGKQGIQYSALVVPLIKAVQELSAQVEALKNN